MPRTRRAAFGFAAAPSLALLAALTGSGIGCTPTGKAEADKTTMDKVNDKTIDVEHKVGDATGTAIKATGNAIKAGGESLEHAAAESVKQNIGKTAGKAVENTGKALETVGGSVASGGDKLKEASKPVEPVVTPADASKPVVEPTTPVPVAPAPGATPNP